jgi:SAM-dependent methyltransferase
MPHSEHFALTGSVRSFGYCLLWSCANALQKAANACLYIAAGLLRQDDLRAASRLRWRVFGQSVDDFNTGLEPWERRLYSDLLRRSDRVLLIGCGTGRDLVGLLELGYNVTALEQAPELVDLARAHLVRRGMVATVLAGDVESVDLARTFDAVIFSPGVYSCLHHRASRVATLARIESHLSREGRILISYIAFVQQSPLSMWLMRISAQLTRADWRPERGDSFSRDHVVGHVLRYEHLFRPGEVAHECAAADLRVIRDEVARSPFNYAVAVPTAVARVEPAEPRQISARTSPATPYRARGNACL